MFQMMNYLLLIRLILVKLFLLIFLQFFGACTLEILDQQSIRIVNSLQNWKKIFQKLIIQIFQVWKGPTTVLENFLKPNIYHRWYECT